MTTRLPVTILSGFLGSLLVVNDTDGSSFAVWQHVERTGGAEISTAELTLIGIFNANGAVSASQFLLL